MRRAIAALVLVGCAGHAGPRVEWFVSGRSAMQLVASRSGRTIAVVDDGAVELVEHDSGERMLGRGPGAILGEPGDRDVLVVEAERVRWLVAGRGVDLGLPPGFTWHYLGGATDHAAHRATLVMEPALVGLEPWPRRSEVRAGLWLIELDTEAMAVVGRKAVSIEGRATLAETLRRIEAADAYEGYGLSVAFAGDCAVAGADALYITCRAPDRDGGDRWIASRYDRLALAWSTRITLAPARGRAAILTAVAGDRRTLVIVHGDVMRGVVMPRRTALVDAGTGGSRVVAHAQPVGYLHQLVPVPGRAAVAELYLRFPGLSLLDTRSGALAALIAWPETLADQMPLGVAIAADGTLVFGGHAPR